MIRRRRSDPGRSRGFTLLEVLIALVILAIGLLGLAALQARGLKFNTDAYVRSQANVMAYRIMEHMRIAGSDNADKFTAGDPRPTTDCDDPGDHTAAGTTDAEVDQMLACWYQDLQNTIPSGGGGIAATANDDEYDVTVSWFDRESESTKTQTWTIRVF